MEGSLSLYAAKSSGTLWKMERSILATKVPRVSCAMFADVLEQVSTFLEGCFEADEIDLLADVVTQHLWPQGEDALRVELEKDPGHFRRHLN